MHDEHKFEPDNIIMRINKCDKMNMVKLYIYKIIFNQNNRQINIFLNDVTKNKYKLNKYDNFSDLFKFKEEDVIYKGINEISDNDNYKYIYKKLSDYQKDIFKNKITKEDISIQGKLYFDDFYQN